MNALNTFLLDVAERAGKTAVQAALLQIGASNADHLNALTVNWATVGEYALGGAILSILTSLASAPAQGNGTASLISQVVTALPPKVTVPQPPSFSAPTTTPTTGGNTMAPIADDGTTEYETYQGSPQNVAKAAAADAAAAETAKTVEAPVTPVEEPVQDNGDGSVTINGVTYYPHTDTPAQ